MFGILKKLKFLKSKKEFVLFLKGKSYKVPTDHPHYDTVAKMLDAQAPEEEFILLLDEKTKFVEVINEVKEDIVTDSTIELDEFDNLVYNGVVVPIDAAMHAKELKRRDGKIDSAFDNFLQNLVKNPSMDAVKDLYSFMLAGKMPITADGHFCAYRVVNSNFRDKHTNTFDNSIGKIVEMPRELCDNNKHQTCSCGLHFCSESYISSFRSGGDKLIMVKINPADVVAIPTDYNQAKGRCCKFEVIREIQLGEITDVGVVDDTIKYTVHEDDVPDDEDVNEPDCHDADINEPDEDNSCVALDEEVDTQPEPVIPSQNSVKNQKTCSCCKKTLPIESFSKKAASKDGYNGQCKACVKSKRKK